MKCGFCGYENMEGAVFCEQCGKKLEISGHNKASIQNRNVRICPNCQFENPLKAMFCLECGSRLNDEMTPMDQDMTVAGGKEVYSWDKNVSSSFPEGNDDYYGPGYRYSDIHDEQNQYSDFHSERDTRKSTAASKRKTTGRNKRRKKKNSFLPVAICIEVLLALVIVGAIVVPRVFPDLKITSLFQSKKAVSDNSDSAEKSDSTTVEKENNDTASESEEQTPEEGSSTDTAEPDYEPQSSPDSTNVENNQAVPETSQPVVNSQPAASSQQNSQQSAVNSQPAAGSQPAANGQSAAVSQQNSQPTAYDITEGGIHSYGYYVTDCSWSEAFRYAQKNGGYLARINSEEEFNYIVGEIQQKGLSDIVFYLGGRRDWDSYSYYWVDTSNRLYGEVINDGRYWAYSRFPAGEPSFWDGDIQEAYLTMFFYRNENRFILNDEPDNPLLYAANYIGNVGFIVEFE